MSKLVKTLKNLEKSQQITFYFSKKEEENKNILLVLPIEEISLQPELSSPPRFRIQAGGSIGIGNGRRTEILVFDIG